MKNLNQRILLEKTLLNSIKNGIMLYDERETVKVLHKTISKNNKNIKKGLKKMIINIKEIKENNGLHEYVLKDGSEIIATQHEHDKLFYNTADGIDALEITFKGSTPGYEPAFFTPVFNEVEYSDDPIECIGFIKQ